jgi:hypothetical protein
MLVPVSFPTVNRSQLALTRADRPETFQLCTAIVSSVQCYDLLNGALRTETYVQSVKGATWGLGIPPHSRLNENSA